MKSTLATTLALLPLVAFNATAQAAADPARDRQSILAMQGEHIVDFAFDETVLLQPGYERASAVRSGGNEVVIVVEDTSTTGGSPIKAIEAVRKVGGEVVAVAVVVDRATGAKEIIEAAGVQYRAAISLDDLGLLPQ